MEELREKCSSLEQERDKDDDELAAKNQKLHKKADKYKSELIDAKRDASALKSQLQQALHDKVSSRAENCHVFRIKWSSSTVPFLLGPPRLRFLDQPINYSINQSVD